MSDYGFQLDPEIVRVDLFKPSGKWYTTIELKFDNYHSKKEHILTTFQRCMSQQYPKHTGFTAVCLEPYHEHTYPLLVKV